ncbi:MAG TPA: ATP-binding protein, partial [Blastocatellia bacterium]|nr:ATP-binding protein [Blastocatellia bacterium]
LILNAQQAIDRAGSITVRTSKYEEVSQSSISVEISDTGCGMSPVELSRIFEPFFSMRKDGTGLGLWVTQNIVRQHGGRIEVISSEEAGTTFQIILPVDSPALMSVAKK